MNYQLLSSDLKVSVNSKGAELGSIKNKSGFEFLWQGDPSIWARRAPVLFPIVGKLKMDHFIFDNEKYHLSQHGFARDSDFELSYHNESELQFELKENIQTKQVYPFNFILKIGYQVLQNELICSYSVVNPTSKPIYFSLGAHPGFQLQTTDEEPANYYVELENDELKVSMLENGLILKGKQSLRPKNQRISITSQTFKHDALVFEENQIQKMVLGAYNSSQKIELNCEGWPYFGIWSKWDSKSNESPKYICLEPWFGRADGVDHDQQLITKKGIIKLQPYAEFNAKYSLRFF